MADFPADLIEQAGKYLLERLLAAEKLPYSTFYDGTDEMHEQLMKSMGLEDDYYAPEHLLDLAAYELEEQEIVEREPLTERLDDGEEDYLITLTPEGRKKINAGFQPEYWHAK